jgi:hypothetical protein
MYFVPAEVKTAGGAEVYVIGRTEQDHNVVDIDGLRGLMNISFQTGLSLNDRHKSQVCLVLQTTTDSLADALLACVILRTLYGLGIIDCAAIIMSPPPVDSPDPLLAVGGSVLEHAREVKLVLRSLGMPHVEVLVATSYAGRGLEIGETVVDYLVQVYSRLPPAGVSLLVSGSFGDVAGFADKHQLLFKQYTQAVYLIGGVQRPANRGGKGNDAGISRAGTSFSDMYLRPDPEAINHSTDLPNAQSFFKLCQDFLVRLVVLSQHFTKKVLLPRTLFDALGSHGGELGTKLFQLQRSSISALWETVSSINAEPRSSVILTDVPLSWNRKRFVDKFCEGHDVTSTGGPIWDSVRSFEIGTTLALLAATPHVFDNCFQATTYQVRSVNHLVYGESEEMTGSVDCGAQKIQGLIFQCLFKGTRLNNSEYDLKQPPMIELGSAENRVEWRFDPREEALDWLIKRPTNSDSPRETGKTSYQPRLMV